MIYLLLAVVIGSIILAYIRLGNMKHAYLKLRKALGGHEIQLFEKYSRSMGNDTRFLKGTYAKKYELHIHNYFDAAATSGNRTYVELKSPSFKKQPILFLMPYAFRNNSSYGGTRKVKLVGLDQFSRRFAVASNDETFTQLLFQEEDLRTALLNLRMLKKGVLLYDYGVLKFTLTRNLRDSDVKHIPALLDFMAWFFEKLEQFEYQ